MSELTVPTAADHVSAPTDANPLATLLRWLGGGLVLLAGASFMLQGFENIAAELRNWSILGLMALCAAAAVVIQRSFADAKGARLLFGLAVVLVPVQFSQLAGVVHEIATPGAGAQGALAFVGQWLPAIAAPGTLIMLALATLVVGAGAASAGMRILAGNAGRSLALALVALSSLLLIPARDSFAGVLVLLLMVAGYWATLRWVDFRAPHLRTFEGRTALLLLALPVLIAAVRFGLHAQTLGSLCALFGLLAIALVELPRRLFVPGRLTSLLALIGLSGFAVAWLSYAQEWLAGFSASVAMPLAVVPVIAYWLESSRWLASGAPLVRFGTALLMLALTVGQLEAGTFAAALSLLATAGAYLYWGVARQYRDPAIAGGVLVLLAVLQCLQLSLAGIAFNGWLVLAVAGLTLVVSASVLERHGRALLGQTRQAWTRVQSWR